MMTFGYVIVLVNKHFKIVKINQNELTFQEIAALNNCINLGKNE